MDGAVSKVLETFDVHVAASDAALILELHELEANDVRFASEYKTLKDRNASQTAQLALDTHDLTKTKNTWTSLKTEHTVLKRRIDCVDELKSAVESASSVYSRKMKTANQLDIDRK